MALFDDIYGGARKIFLAGVGAVALGAEKSQELAEELIRKGEQTVDKTVEQGKNINEEFARRVRETADGASDEMLRNKFRAMSVEERAAWIARAQRISDDLEAEDADYEVEEDVPPVAPDEPEEDVESAEPVETEDDAEV